ncbi:MAG: hypothetical protein LBR57_03765 [Alistipes sp.]|nr:hypothetical protein [Alistipes sp.]
MAQTHRLAPKTSTGAKDFNLSLLPFRRLSTVNALHYGYNFLNLLGNVKSGSTVKATYRWLADGTKAGVKTPAGTAGYEYLGSLIYARNANSELVLESTGFSGGRIFKTSNDEELNFFITDHLGSVRVVMAPKDPSGGGRQYIYDEEGNIIAIGSTPYEFSLEAVARNDYYAFGKPHVNSLMPMADDKRNRWLYNGKENQLTGDLRFLDYGARMYDSEIARWTTPDPLLEKYYRWSPYNYTLNNPVKFIDRFGLWVDGYVVDNQGNLHWVNNAGGHEYDVLFESRSYREGRRNAEDGVNVGKIPKSQKALTLRTINENDEIIRETRVDYFVTESDSDATAFFEFMADNTDVEWSNRRLSTDTGEEMNLIVTSHEETSVRGSSELMGQKYYRYKNVERMDHSHPNTPTPSENDRESAQLYKGGSPKAHFRIRYNQQYYEYDKNGNKK